MQTIFMSYILPVFTMLIMMLLIINVGVPLGLFYRRSFYCLKRIVFTF